MADRQDEMRKLAAGLLERGEVSAVIGYGPGSRPDRTTPLVVTTPAQCAELVWNEHCTNNLAVYLTRAEVQQHAKVALIGKGCDVKSLAGLIQEGQVERDRVVVIGMACDGMAGSMAPLCRHCDVHTPPFHDHLVGVATAANGDPAAFEKEEIARIEALTPAERWAEWQAEFARCIRCYACRQACPLCYCKTCIVEKNQPQWIPTSAHDLGNFAWNIMRALHLAGRCVGCGACDRACPQGIRLSLLNRKLAETVAAQFNYRPGYDAAAKPAMRIFDPKDSDELFR